MKKITLISVLFFTFTHLCVGFAYARTSVNIKLTPNLCENPLAQQYTTTSHFSTKIKAGGNINYYSDGACSSVIAGVSFTTGSFNLHAGSGTLYLCSPSGTGSGYAGPTACSNNVQSIRITSLTTDTGTWSVTSNCIILSCTGNNFNGWSTPGGYILAL